MTDKKDKGNTIYINNEALKLLKDLNIKVGPFEAKYNSDKIIALVHLYKEGLK